MPTIDVGGVEKNFILISNFLSQNLEKVTIVTTSYKFKNVFKNNIKFVSLKNKNIEILPRRIKFLITLILTEIGFSRGLVQGKDNTLPSIFSISEAFNILHTLIDSFVISSFKNLPKRWSGAYGRKDGLTEFEA